MKTAVKFLVYLWGGIAYIFGLFAFNYAWGNLGMIIALFVVPVGVFGGPLVFGIYRGAWTPALYLYGGFVALGVLLALTGGMNESGEDSEDGKG